MSEGLYVSYTTDRDGCELKWSRSSYTIFRALPVEKAVKLLRSWADELEGFSKTRIKKEGDDE